MDSFIGPGMDSFIGPGMDSFVGPVMDSFVGPGMDSFIGPGMDLFIGPVMSSTSQNVFPTKDTYIAQLFSLYFNFMVRSLKIVTVVTNAHYKRCTAIIFLGRKIDMVHINPCCKSM